jgi:pimeloyl-ACP methyl ester carboxylesterase
MEQSTAAKTADEVLGMTVRRTTIPSGEMAFIDEGHGPPVVLLHGAPLTSLGFVRVVRSLRAHYRVIAPDFPGFGQSRPAASFDGSLPAYARSIEELVTRLGLQRFVLFGCDAGACVGMAAAAAMHARIAGLVIADTVPIPLQGRAWFIKMILRHVVTSWPVRSLNRRLNLLPWLVATVDPHRRPFSASERAVLIGQYGSAAKRDRILDMFSAMGRGDDFMRETAAQVAERLCDRPVLLIVGQFDPVRLVGSVSRYKKLFRGAIVNIIPWERHFPILGAGEQVAQALESWMRGIGWQEATIGRHGTPAPVADVV